MYPGLLTLHPKNTQSWCVCHNYSICFIQNEQTTNHLFGQRPRLFHCPRDWASRVFLLRKLPTPTREGRKHPRSRLAGQVACPPQQREAATRPTRNATKTRVFPLPTNLCKSVGALVGHEPSCAPLHGPRSALFVIIGQNRWRIGGAPQGAPAPGANVSIVRSP